jgi:lysophospholipase L1-like esterase
MNLCMLCAISSGMRFLTLSLLALILPLQTNAASAYTTDLMVTAGDSISAGFLANWRAQHTGVRENEIIDRDWPDYGPAPSRLVDDPVNHPRHSISEFKLKLAQLLNHKYTLSWSSGMSIHSHYERLKEYLAKESPETSLVIQNVARSGAVAADLDLQANQILNAWNTGRYTNLRYLTMTIGANDACAPWYVGGNPDAEIEFNIRKFFKRLSVIQQKEPIRVLISSIPNIPDLGKPEILHHDLTAKKTCEQRMRFQDRYCLPLMIWSTPEEYAQKVAIVAHKNDVLRNLVQELGHEYPQFQFVFSESLFKRKIRIDFLSKDCFHPNPDGQDEISEQLWDDQPWFKNAL